MEVKIFEDYIATVDSKGRVIIPKDFMWEDGEEVAFFLTGKSYYNVYPLVKIQEFIDALEEKKKSCSIEERREIKNMITQTYYSILDTYVLDSQRRLLLPKQIREDIPQGKVVMQGINTHISICPTNESYQELCAQYLPQNVGIKKL